MPWRAVKSRCGAPNHIATQGFACPTHTCPYYQIADAEVHALAGDGTHGKHERIQTFRCQACKTTFNARRDTPLAPAQDNSSTSFWTEFTYMFGLSWYSCGQPALIRRVFVPLELFGRSLVPNLQRSCSTNQRGR